MIIRRFAKALREQDWLAVFVEILVVIVGLMLAFQLDRWWEARGDRALEAEYIERLIADIEIDIEALEFSVELQTVRRNMADLLIAVAADPQEAEIRPVEFLGAILQSSFLYTPIPTAHTFEDMRATGNMGLLQNADIKNLLFDYHGYHANQRMFDAIWFEKELHHLKLASGISSHEQDRFIHDAWFYFGPEDIEDVREATYDLESVRAAVRRFLARREFIDWLPQTRIMQVEQIKRNESALEKAIALHTELNDYLALIQP
jgi:hypothetical protein